MLPQVIRDSVPVGDCLPDRLDALVCSASFEARCLTVPGAIRRDDYVKGPVLIASNAGHVPAIEKNEAALFKMFPEGIRCHLDPNDPLETADLLMGLLGKLPVAGSCGRVIGFDVTTFTRESLLMLLSCFYHTLMPQDVLIGFYNRARGYEGERERDQWLSRGVREIRSVIGFPGDLKPTRRRHLVVLAGFEDDRAMHLAAELEPSVLSLGTPDPEKGHAAEHDEKMQIRKKRWLSHQGAEVTEFSFDGYSIEKCIESIRLAVGEEMSMNTILAPMNTKVSTLAAGIYALGNPSVQITYAQADVYNHARYSRPAEEVYVFDLSSSIKAHLDQA